ncbi:MAG: tyrosine--tRNA ligase [Conexivisphaerales archaeon]
MDIDSKVSLVAKPPTEEIVTLEDLRSLFQSRTSPSHYIGFEISGLLHLGTIVISGYKLRDMMQAGIKATVFLADWHSVINKKLGGDWERIKEASKYYEEAFSAFVPGVNIVLGSDLYAKEADYWKNVIEFSSHVSLARATRTLTIMGRSMKESLDIAQFFYPSMQAVDIHTLNAEIAHAGIDQRKVHMLAREVYPKMGWKPPVAVHHAILLGLSKPERSGLEEDAESDLIISGKMSKSKPKSAIFIHDSTEEIYSKIASAWCPVGEVRLNPILQYAKLIVFHDSDEFRVEREKKFGGDIVYGSYEELEKDYLQRKIHPADLKQSVAREIDKVISPLRARFEGRKERIVELFADKDGK